MKIIVTAKQVPDTNEVKIDPVKGTLIREGVPSILNPDDANALEAALQLKDANPGSTVTVVSMGPNQALTMLHECIAMGADDAVLPRIVPSAEFDPSRPHRITCTVNGVTVQDDDVTNMLFSCGEIVEYISAFMPLKPGDLIFTGTPAGVILGKPKGTRVWLKPGDEVSVAIEGIGTLTNRLV